MSGKPRSPILIDILDPGDAGTIKVPRHNNLTCILNSAGAETRTMGAPTFPGQCAHLLFNVDGGDCVVTIAATVNQTGNNTLTFADAGDFIELRGCLLTGALVWRTVANDGVGLSTV